MAHDTEGVLATKVAAGAPADSISLPSDGNSRHSVEDGSSDFVRVTVGHRPDRPSDRLLSDGPDLGDFFDSLVKDAGFGDDARVGTTECMDIKFTKDECRDLGIRARFSRLV